MAFDQFLGLSANDPLALTGMRKTRSDELRRNLAKRGGGFSTGGTPTDLDILDEDINQDPDTGLAAQKHTNDIEGLNDYLTTRNRPDVKAAADEDYKQKYDLAVGPARQAAIASSNNARIAGDYALSKQQLANEGALETAKVRNTGSKLQSGLMERVAGSQVSLDTLNQLRQSFKPEYVGPGASLMNDFIQKVPGVASDPGYAQFKADTDTLTNAIIKATTGAQMSEPEAKRIKGQIPLVSDKPEVWNAKAAASERNLKMLIQRIEALSHGGGADEGSMSPEPYAAPEAEFAPSGVSPGMAFLGAGAATAAAVPLVKRAAQSPAVKAALQVAGSKAKYLGPLAAFLGYEALKK